MTAVYNAIRSLDAMLDHGRITPEEYARRRQSLLQNIEDAETDLVDASPTVEPAVRAAPSIDVPNLKTGSSAFGLGLVVVLAVMGLCIGLTLFFLPSMNLALTLGVTILAALCVALLQTSDD